MRFFSLLLIALMGGCSSWTLREEIHQESVERNHAESPPRGTPESICPKAVSVQLNGFFRWYLNSQGNKYRDEFASQQQRFLPILFRELRKRLAIPLADAEVLAFDPFSGSKLPSFNYWIGGCRKGSKDRLLARIAVLSGKSRKNANWQVVDYVLAPVGATWLIADLRYPEKGELSLMRAISDLNKPMHP